MSVRTFLAALVALTLSAGAALAGTELPFTQADFARSQQEGRPILVDVWASWCPVCKAQAPTLSAIQADPANPRLVIYKVDFDAQKDVVKAFGVRSQSTLIAFNGKAEAGRSTGDTNPDSIRALVAKAGK